MCEPASGGSPEAESEMCQQNWGKTPSPFLPYDHISGLGLEETYIRSRNLTHTQGIREQMDDLFTDPLGVPVRSSGFWAKNI